MAAHSPAHCDTGDALDHRQGQDHENRRAGNGGLDALHPTAGADEEIRKLPRLIPHFRD
jgi:hypothetical protein